VNHPATSSPAAADIKSYMQGVGEAARAAARAMARAGTGAKNAALVAAAEALIGARDQIIAANAGDVARARAGGADAAFIDRLVLDAASVAAMAAGLR
jgi:glutamate-5-semialdehyde dehydrogenase